MASQKSGRVAVKDAVPGTPAAGVLEDSIDRCIEDAVLRYEAIDPEVEGIVDRAAAIDKRCRRVFEETLAALGLSHADYKVLLQLAVPAPRRLSAGDLSRTLMLTSGGMTARLDRLEAAGRVRRVRDPDDRRGVLVELTPEGQELIDQAVAEEAAKEIDLFRSISPDEVRELNGLLRRVLAGLEDRFGPTQREADEPGPSVGVPLDAG